MSDMQYLIDLLQQMENARKRVYAGIESRTVSQQDIEQYRLLIRECSDLLQRKADGIESAYDHLDTALFYSEQQGLIYTE